MNTRKENTIEIINFGEGRRRGEIQEYRIEALDLFLPLETLEWRRGEDKLEKQHVPPLFFSRHKFTDGRLGRIS